MARPFDGKTPIRLGNRVKERRENRVKTAKECVTVYTPFCFILFYEVLQLVFALPRSHTSSIAMQYEILSLIVIRRVFKDIGQFRDPATWLEQTDAALIVVLDMLAALAMFALIAVFRRVRRTVQPSQENPHLEQCGVRHFNGTLAILPFDSATLRSAGRPHRNSVWLRRPERVFLQHQSPNARRRLAQTPARRAVTVSKANCYGLLLASDSANLFAIVKQR